MAPFATAQAAPLTIERDKLYPLAEFVRITNFGRHAMRQARRRGLKVHYSGNRAFVHGADFFAYLDSAGGADGKAHES
jgi:hypothetical protein